MTRRRRSPVEGEREMGRRVSGDETVKTELEERLTVAGRVHYRRLEDDERGLDVVFEHDLHRVRLVDWHDGNREEIR